VRNDNNKKKLYTYNLETPQRSRNVD